MSRRQDRIYVDQFSVEVHIVRFVEAELRRHPGRKRRLSKLLAEVGGATASDIIHAQAPTEPGMPRAPGVGNPTQRKVMNLFKRDEIAHLTAQIRTIEEVFGSLPEDLQQAVDKVYFAGRWTKEGAAMELEIDRKTLRSRCNRAILQFVLSIVGDHAVLNETA